MQTPKRLKISSNFSHLEKFKSLPPHIERPLWSVMIPTYNCAHFLRETLVCVLKQDLGPDLMQIEVIDDCSTKDNPEQVVNEVGKGRISFYRQPQNVGHTRNFDTCIRRAKGQLVHILHGDDRVKNGFYEKMQYLFETNIDIGAAFCRFYHMDETANWTDLSNLEEKKSGLLSDALIRIARNQIIQPPSIVVRREVYEALGGFDHRLKYGEDWEMWVRISANFPIGFETEPLAEYRVSKSSITGNFARNGDDIRYTIKVIKIISEYIDKRQRAYVEKHARHQFAIWHRGQAFNFYYRLKDYTGAKNQLRGIIRLYPSITFLPSIITMYIKVLLAQNKISD